MLKHAKKLVTLVSIALVALSLSACASTSKTPVGTTDEMFSDTQDETIISTMVVGDEVISIGDGYPLDLFGNEFADGHFYRITADVTYLNGGIAGYVDFPQIDRVINVEEISPYALELPSVTETWHGLVDISSYAEADFLYYEGTEKLVWKDGEWIYRYSDTYKRDDGSCALCRANLSPELIEAGIADGTVLCSDYFLLPALETE